MNQRLSGGVACSLSVAGVRVFLLAFLLIAIGSQAQFRGDHLPGFVGLQAGTQPPPGLYIGNVVFAYPTGTIKDDSGNKVNSHGEITMLAPIILVSLTTNYKVLGANVGTQVALPFIRDRLQLNRLDITSDIGFSDMFLSPIVLGWHLKRADVMASYNLYLPTGSFSPSLVGNTGLGMYGHEFSIGTTAYLDQKKTWHAAGNFALEFHTHKKGLDLTVGDLATIEGGLGKALYKKVSGPIPLITNIGIVGYSQFKVTNDNGSDLPLLLRGLKDRVFALGPEINIFIPQPRLTLLARYIPEFGARNRTQGQTIIFSVVWVAKSLVKPPHP